VAGLWHVTCLLFLSLLPFFPSLSPSARNEAQCRRAIFTPYSEIYYICFLRSKKYIMYNDFARCKPKLRDHAGASFATERLRAATSRRDPGTWNLEPGTDSPSRSVLLPKTRGKKKKKKKEGLGASVTAALAFAANLIRSHRARPAKSGHFDKVTGQREQCRSVRNQIAILFEHCAAERAATIETLPTIPRYPVFLHLRLRER